MLENINNRLMTLIAASAQAEENAEQEAFALARAVVEKLVPVEEKKTVLEDYDMATAVEYTTLYRPDTLCVDVFRSVPDRVKLE